LEVQEGNELSMVAPRTTVLEKNVKGKEGVGSSKEPLSKRGKDTRFVFRGGKKKRARSGTKHTTQK